MCTGVEEDALFLPSVQLACMLPKGHVYSMAFVVDLQIYFLKIILSCLNKG